ncbi:MAG: Uma2 family endonuclease [Microcoleaceae cyanobacterium]
MIAVPNYISPEEYLEIEYQNPLRHEYRRGLVYAMSGGSDNHDRIAFNFLKLIDNHLGDDTECRLYSGNVKVNYQDQFYYYPDAFVTCDERDRSHRFLGARTLVDCVGVASPSEISPGSHRYIKRYPKLIAEVLSPSTEAFDLSEKFEDYQQLETLQEYILIYQEKQQVKCRRRTDNNTLETIIYKFNNSIFLDSINLEFAVAKLYRGLD